jgi:hypothetical protein
MPSKIEIEAFVRDWVVLNVRKTLSPASLPLEVDRLAAQLTGDARARGISGRDLDKTLGNIDDYLTGQCQRAADAAFRPRT